VGPAGADDEAWTNRLHAAVRPGEFDEGAVRIRLRPGRRDPALDDAAERHEMGLEDPLSLVLRQAALERAAAVEAVVARGAKLGHARPVEAGTPDALGGIQERLQQADGIQDLEGTGLNRRGARLAVRPGLPLDEPSPHAVAGELGGGEQPGGARADDQDVVSCHSISPRKPAVRGRV
jgi:hypothetical protein